METLIYKPKGVCSQTMRISHENGILLALEVEGGCSGNLQSIASLAIGMKISDLIAKLKGIRCGHRHTSCGDQIAQALETIK